MIDKFISNAKRSEQALKGVGDEAEKSGRKADQSASEAAEAIQKQGKETEEAGKKSSKSAEELRKLADAHHEAATQAGLQYDRSGQLVDSNGRVLTSAQAASHGLDSFSEAVYRTGEEQAKAAAKAEAYAAKQSAAQQTVGTSLVAFGTTTVAALGAATKAAMDWESAWAGVTKTVDGTPEQMAEIEQGLRGLAKTLPSTHTEIAAVAEAAGQLGVKREDILKFTKTMVDLGETTNLTAEEAATDIAQIANVMGTTGDEIDNFGAALVALGNDGASTEKDILSMAQRIAGAGKLVGASEADVLALSNTLASMGVKAELGGGVATRALLKMYAAVQGGGPKLEAFAKTAGVSAETFSAAFRTSPVAALEMVTKGMERTKTEGGNVVEVLKDMGLKGTEEMQVMLALAGAGDLLSESLALGSKAWQENTALTDEAAKRYETTESKVTVAWNNIKDAAIDAGAVMLPILQGVAENVAGLAQAFGDLPPWVQSSVTTLAAVVGTVALVGGGIMLLLPKVRDGAAAFKELNTKSDGSSRGMGKIAKAAGLATAGLVALNAVGAIGNQIFGKAAVSTEQFSQGLLTAAANAGKLDNLNELFKDGGLGTNIDGVGDAIARMSKKDGFDDISIWLGDVTGSGSKLNTLRDNLKGVDGALTGLVTGGKGAEAGKSFKAIADAAKEQGVPIEKLVDMFPQYRDRLLETMNAAGQTDVTQQQLAEAMLKGGTAAEIAAAGADKTSTALSGVVSASGGAVKLTEDMAEALDEVGLAADGTVVDLVKFTDALLNAGLIQLSARDAARGFEEAIDAVSESIKTNGTTLDTNTEQGRKNEAVLDGIASAGYRVIEANAKNGASQESLQKNLKDTYDELIAGAGQFGITGGAADALARDILKIPADVNIDTYMSDQAKLMVESTIGVTETLVDRLGGLHKKIQETPDKEIHITEPQSPEVIKGLENLGYIVTHLPDGTIRVGETGTDATGQKIDATAGAKRTATITAEAITAAAEEALNRAALPRSASITLLASFAEAPPIPASIARRAGGGDLDSAPGPAGVDSKLFWGAKGEHVLTDRDVDAMGGQGAVYQFRKQLHSGGVPRHRTGGQVGSYASSAQVVRDSYVPGPVRASAEPVTKKVDQHFHGVQDPAALAYYAARLQERGY